MEKINRKTRDFMNVESFSQLPFIRPAVPPPLKETNVNRGATIRLFGQEFRNNNNTDNLKSNSTENNNNAQDGDSINTKENITNRKFECHYCFRNFPTSQALGGHQNAHKREREQAKRAHLQSSIGLSDSAHVYGMMNYYNRVPTLSTGYMNSWNNIYSSVYNTRLHAGYVSPYNASPQSQPLNGSPLGLWRNIPTPHFGSSAHQSPLLYELKPDMQDHMSLDLHL